MVYFIEWVFLLLDNIVRAVVSGFMALIEHTFNDYFSGVELGQYDLDLYLFSDNLVLSMPIYDIVLLVIILIVVFVAVRVIWKVLKKVFRKLFFWGRW